MGQTRERAGQPKSWPAACLLELIWWEINVIWLDRYQKIIAINIVASGAPQNVAMLPQRHCKIGKMIQ